MHQLKSIELDGMLQDGKLHFAAQLPAHLDTPVKIIVVYQEAEAAVNGRGFVIDAPTTENEADSEDDFEFQRARWHQQAVANGYDTKEKILELVREVKREQARELGLFDGHQ